MKSLYHILLYIVIIIAVCFFGTSVFAQDHSLPDSLITDDYVYEYTFSDFDKAERIMQELRKRKTLPDYNKEMKSIALFHMGRMLYNREQKSTALE